MDAGLGDRGALPRLRGPPEAYAAPTELGRLLDSDSYKDFAPNGANLSLLTELVAFFMPRAVNPDNRLANKRVIQIRHSTAADRLGLSH